jgi:hypothetical protein
MGVLVLVLAAAALVEVLHCRDYLLLTLVPVLLAEQYPGVNRNGL